MKQLDVARAQLRREARAEQREPVPRGRPRHMDVRLGNVDVAVRTDNGDGASGVAQRIALPPHGDGDARDVRERDIGEEGNVHAESVGGRG